MAWSAKPQPLTQNRTALAWSYTKRKKRIPVKKLCLQRLVDRLETSVLWRVWNVSGPERVSYLVMASSNVKSENHKKTQSIPAN